MNKKKQLTKKQVGLLMILHSVCAIMWIIQAIQYAYIYPVICDIVANVEISLISKSIAAIAWSATAIACTVKFIRFDEHSQKSDA